jgi:hypothetical protein
MKKLKLENDGLRAGFDAKTGALVELGNPRTGWSIVRQTGLGLSFGMVVPLPDRLNHRVFGERQKLTRCVFDKARNRLTLVWDRPVSETGMTIDATFTGVVTLTEFGLEFTGEVVNRGVARIDNVAWPCVGEVAPPRRGGELWRWSAANTELSRRQMLPRFANEQGYWGADYPAQKAHTPHSAFLMVGDEQQGLYVGHHCTTNDELVQFLFELKPGHESMDSMVPSAAAIGGEPVRVQMTVNHFPFCARRASVALTPIVLRPYEGSWHAGADIYKRWRAKWHQAAPAPDWTRDIHAWQQIQVNSIAGEQRCRYDRLVEHGRQCAKHGVGVIQLTGWTDHGQDGRMPSHDIDPRLGTRKELKKAIADLHALGVRTVLYEKFVYADVSTNWYKRELHRYVGRDIHGNAEGHAGWAYFLPAHFAEFNMRRLDWGCMHHPAWRRVCREEYKRSLDLDADGVLLDESCHHRGDGRYCFARDHGHAVPAFNPQGDSRLLAEFNEIAARQKRPQLIVAEAAHDLQTTEYGMSYGRFGAGHIPLLRYLDPFYPIMMAVTGYDDREKINACLRYRYILSYEPLAFKGGLDDFPLTITYGKMVDALRRRYQAEVWDARFVDRLGVKVTTNDMPYTDYSVFLQPATGRRSVVVVNNDRRKPLRVRVAIGRRSGPWLVATPEKPKAVKVMRLITLPPRSVAVVMEAQA